MLGEHHVVSVALGPPEDVVDAWGVSCHLSCGPNYCCICTHVTQIVLCTLHVPTNYLLQLHRSDLSCVLLFVVSFVRLLVLSLWKAAFLQSHGGWQWYAYVLAGHSSYSKVSM